MKLCSVCGRDKPIEDFQIRRASPDGRTAACRLCLSQRDAWRANDPKRVAARARIAAERLADPIKKAIDEQHRRDWAVRKRNPLKRQAHITAGNAIRDGKLMSPDACEECRQASDQLHAHHEDYSKPLEVIWLCPPCHGYRHQQINDEMRAVARHGMVEGANA